MTLLNQDEITNFFRQVVTAVNETVGRKDANDPALWDLAQRLHSIWREALRRAHSAGTARPSVTLTGHPALEELMRMIDVEAGE